VDDGPLDHHHAVPTPSRSQDRSTLGVFASFTSIAAFLFAILAILVVNDNTASVTATAAAGTAVLRRHRQHRTR
jgi:hypothetical protein